MVPKPLYRQVYEKFQLGPASHMTHVENFPKILKSGAILSFNAVQGQSYQNLSNQDVQSGRAGITIAVSGRPLHDYVPLYFGRLTPMAAVNQDKNDNLLFLRFSLDILQTAGAVISDGNARSGATKFRLFQQLDDLAHVDSKAINTVKYAGDSELKRRKQAEILIPDRLPADQILDIICHSDESRAKVLEISDQYGMKFNVIVNPGWYFHTPVPKGTSQA